ncbi:MAG: alpha/beta fold hydrolase [Myxococcales bacterium]
MDSSLHSNKSTNGRVYSEPVVEHRGAPEGPERGAPVAGQADARAEPQLQQVRRLLRVLDFVSPKLSARAAEPLFMSPRRHRRPPEEQQVLASARRELWHIAGHRVPVYSWGQGPVVLFSHGWEGRGSQVAPFVASLVAQGFRVVSWDQPGHGDAEAARVTVMEFTEVLEGIVKRVGEVHAVIGHSLGGTAAVYARSRRSFGRRLITIASPLHPREFLAEFGRTLQLSRAALEGVKARLGERYGVNFEGFDLRQLTPRLELPALVVHDRNDREVPYEHGLELFRHWPSADLFTTQGLGHRRVLRDREVVTKVVEAIAATPRVQSLEQRVADELYEPLSRAS